MTGAIEITALSE